ncbi:Hypothetical Protein OBI_RACECAR_255 [Arthrobacter phage Racecar]|nr:hypothetical protein PBI_RACECAR_47 [Arthrobacter phage Racecar]QFG12731.1 hypothetical protein PBI_MIMI_47 [Arthrobacter phage Mimi]
MDEFFAEMGGEERTPVQKAHDAGYTKGYLAAEAEYRRKDGLREKYAQDDFMPLWEKMLKQEPLTVNEAIRVGQEVSLVFEKNVTNGSLLLHLYEMLIREYNQGKRCSVCCRHSSEGHDCATKC